VNDVVVVEVLCSFEYLADGGHSVLRAHDGWVSVCSAQLGPNLGSPGVGQLDLKLTSSVNFPLDEIWSKSSPPEAS